jgi:drug/metabolite transporter (DMT)-like permease
MSVNENCAYRFIFGSLALLPVLLRRRTKFAPRDFKLLLFASVIGVPVQFLIQFKGLSLTTVSHASLMVGTLPVLLALSSVVVLHERLARTEWMMLAISALGAVFIAMSHGGGGNGPHATAAGDLLVILSMVAAVAMILTSKRLMAEYNPLQVTAEMLIIGTVLLLVFVELTRPVRFHFSGKVWFAAVAQGVLATALAYIFWNWGLARVPAARAGVFLNMEPVVGAILGSAILHESLGGLALVGGAMIIASAVYFSRPRVRSESEAPDRVGGRA